MKYTAEYCRKNDIVVVCDTFEEYQEIKKIDNWSRTNLDKENIERNSPCYFYENLVNNGWDSCSSRYFKEHKGSCTAEEFIRDNEVLPEKWYIKITKENWEYLNKYLRDNINKYPDYRNTWDVYDGCTFDKTYYFYSEQPSDNIYSSYNKFKEFVEIDFKQFLQITSQTNLAEFPKELIHLLKHIK